MAEEWQKSGLFNLVLEELICIFKQLKEYETALIQEVSRFIDVKEEVVIKMIKIIRKYPDDLMSLVNYLTEEGYYSLAKKFHEFSLAGVNKKLNHYGLENFTTDDAVNFLKLFSGNDYVYSSEYTDRTGKRCFTKIKKRIKPEDIIKHVEGEETFDFYPFKDENNVKVMVLDIDITKDCSFDEENYQHNLKNCLTYTIKLSIEAKKSGLFNLIEFSGYKGYHIWFFFDEFVNAVKVRELAFELTRITNEKPDGINVEVFPDRDYLKGGEGCIVKLPLGFHTKTEERSLFIDEYGEFFPNQKNVLSSVELISENKLETVLKLLKVEAEADKCLVKTDDNITKQKYPPLAEKVIEGCNVIKYLINKAETTGYLNHRERFLLLSVLGHIGDEGKNAIHTIIKNCFNYKQSVTEKYIGKKYEYPIGCARIRETYPEITSKVKCDCIFKKIPGGCYPTPALNAVKAHEVEGFSEKITKKQKSIQKNLQPISKEVKKQEFINSSEPVISKISNDSKPRLDNSNNQEKINLYIQKMTKLKKQLRDIEKEIEICDRELNLAFDLMNTDSFEIENGILTRDKSTKITKWRIEI